jgi:hypothetical protein
MPLIKINDIFNELKQQNKRLGNELMFANKCVVILIKFKSYLIII